MSKLFFTLFAMAIAATLQAQQMAYFDAAQAYNKLLLEKNNGTYARIGKYKVVGTPYLFGEKVRGNMFARGQMAYNILLNYDTYNQELQFFSSANPNNALAKSPAEVDSFLIQRNAGLNLPEDMRFINGRFIGAEENSFYRVLHAGPKYALFKKYNAALGVVSTNYIDSDLRQFDLNTEYYYYDAATRKAKKLKPTYAALEKEFGKGTMAQQLDKTALVNNPDSVLITIFAALNQ